MPDAIINQVFYDAGAKALMDAKLIEDNPFPKNTHAFHSWKYGYLNQMFLVGDAIARGIEAYEEIKKARRN
jgi:hypothetical protein